ncbi:hypothetical protein IJU97_03615 [bacterium]|nr:hypothetical protein [bacterium]
MTEETKQLVGNNVPVEEKNESLDQAILDLIQETGSGTGLEGLLSFENKLSEKERKLTPSEISLIINKIKKDIQDPEFLSFESGKLDDKDF